MSKVHDVIAMIEATAGKVFSVTFTKRDGTARTMRARTEFRWTRTTNNPKLTRAYAKEVHALIKVVDMDVARERGKAAAIRSIPAERVHTLTFNGRTYTF